MVERVREYVPGYHLRAEPQFDEARALWKGTARVFVPVEVKGRGDYLPDYAGNLDIITAAAARVGDIMAAHRLGVASTWKSSADLGELAPGQREAARRNGLGELLLHPRPAHAVRRSGRLRRRTRGRHLQPRVLHRAQGHRHADPTLTLPHCPLHTRSCSAAEHVSGPFARVCTA